AAKRLRFGIDAVSKLRRKIVANDEFASHNALCFGVAAAFEFAWFPESSLLGGKGLDNGVEIFLLVRQQFFPGDFQALVLALFVHQSRDNARYWIAPCGVEYRPQPRIDSAFHLQEEHRRVAHPVQKPRTSILARGIGRLTFEFTAPPMAARSDYAAAG